MSNTNVQIRLVSKSHKWRTALTTAIQSVSDKKLLHCEDLQHSSNQDIAIIICDLRHLSWAIKQQQQCIKNQTPSAVVMYDSRHLCLGPFLPAGQSGCLKCFTTWMHNNLKGLSHWGNTEHIVSHQKPTIPLPHSSQKIVDAKLRFWLERLINKPDKLPLKQVNMIDLKSLLTEHFNFINYPTCDVCSSLPDDTPEQAEIQFQKQLKKSPLNNRIENPRLNLNDLKSVFVNRYSGIIKHTFNTLDSNLMPCFASELSVVNGDRIENGYGRCTNKYDSEMVAILEALERFCGHHPRRVKQTIRGSYNEFEQIAVDPTLFTLHTEKQTQHPKFNFVAYHPDLDIDWCWGYSLIHKKPILVPEQLAYYWLENPVEKPTNRFIYDTSNGCATGGCLEEAILCGLLELVERDAYFTNWYGKITPTEIDLNSVDDSAVKDLIARSEAQGYRLHVFDMRLDIKIPVIWAMIVDPSGETNVASYCAASANLDPQQAIFSALVEVTTSMGVYQQSFAGRGQEAQALFEDQDKVTDMFDHVLLFSHPGTLEQLDFLFSDAPLQSIEECFGELEATARSLDLTEELTQCIEQVATVANDIIVVKQSLTEMEDFNLHCVKVLTPGLSPVTFGHQYRRINLPRINRALRFKGLATIDNIDSVNPYPHNFP